MKTRTAAPVLITASLVVLMSGCAGAAAQGGQVHDFLSPEGNAAAVGLARGHVIARDDLSPTRIANRLTAESVAQAVQADGARAMSAEARRELHAQPVIVEQGATTWSAEARRELHAQQTVEQSRATAWTDKVRRELHATSSVGVAVEHPFSSEAIRELHAGAPIGVTAADMQGERLSAYAEAQAAAGVTAAEMQGERLSAYAEARNDAGIREMKAGAPTDVVDTLSPIQGWTPPPEPPAEPVDDYLSPTGGSR